VSTPLAVLQEAHNLHVAFKVPYIYDFITKSCKQQAEVTQNHHNPSARVAGQGKHQQRKHKSFKFEGGQEYYCIRD
jgi:hypothetical protein